MIIPYKRTDIELHFAPYIKNGNTVIQFINAKTQELITNATANINDRWTQEFVALKTDSENQELIDTLIRENVIKDKPVRLYTDLRVPVQVYELTNVAETERQKQYNENQYDRLFLPKGV